MKTVVSESFSLYANCVFPVYMKMTYDINPLAYNNKCQES